MLIQDLYNREIVVVDEDPDFLNLMENIYKALHYRHIHTFTKPADALGFLLHNHASVYRVHVNTRFGQDSGYDLVDAVLSQDLSPLTFSMMSDTNMLPRLTRTYSLQDFGAAIFKPQFAERKLDDLWDITYNEMAFVHNRRLKTEPRADNDMDPGPDTPADVTACGTIDIRAHNVQLVQKCPSIFYRVGTDIAARTVADIIYTVGKVVLGVGVLT